MINDGYAWGYLGETKIKDFEVLKRLEYKVWQMKTVLYFTADWCQPCKKVKPIVEELNREYLPGMFQMIDVDIEKEMASPLKLSLFQHLFYLKTVKKLTV
jgi:thiol-disulfide isomerase/thioredoxin